MALDKLCISGVEKWRKKSQLVSDAISRLLNERARYRVIAKVVEASPRLMMEHSFAWTFQLWYASFASSAIRRQLDVDEGSVSLVSLVNAISRQPECITRELFVEQIFSGHAPDDFAQGLLADRAAAWLNKDGIFDSDRALEELGGLVKQGAIIKKFVNKTIAHADEKHFGNSFGLTFRHVDDVIDKLENFALKYEEMLTGQRPDTLLAVDTMAENLLEEFTFPWWKESEPSEDATGEQKR
jgi:hypothetical protein